MDGSIDGHIEGHGAVARRASTAWVRGWTVIVGIALVACNSDGPSTAVVTPENVDELALTATDTVTRAAVSQSVSAGLFDLGGATPASGDDITISGIGHLDQTQAVSGRLDQGIAGTPTRPIPHDRDEDVERSRGDVYDMPPYTDGSTRAAAADDPLDLCESGGAQVDGSILRFNACDMAGFCVFNGTARIDVSNDGDRFTLSFTGLEVDCDDFQTLVLDGDRLACRGVQTGPLTCDYEISRFVGSLTGARIQVRSMTLGGDLATGFTVRAGIVDPDYGQLNVATVDPIGFEVCPWDVPTDGSIEFAGATPSAGTVEFIGCDEYAVCFYADDAALPVCETKTWASLFDPT